MPCLVVFKLPQNPNDSYDAWDVVEVIQAQQHPGEEVVLEPWRYGFLYITDKNSPFVRPRLLPELLGEEDEEGNAPVIKRRRYRLIPAVLPDEAQYRRYRPYTAPEAVKVVWADFLATHRHDKVND